MSSSVVLGGSARAVSGWRRRSGMLLAAAVLATGFSLNGAPTADASVWGYCETSILGLRVMVPCPEPSAPANILPAVDPVYSTMAPSAWTYVNQGFDMCGCK